MGQGSFGEFADFVHSEKMNRFQQNLRGKSQGQPYAKNCIVLDFFISQVIDLTILAFGASGAYCTVTTMFSTVVLHIRTHAHSGGERP
jgi:hypothetical protein